MGIKRIIRVDMRQAYSQEGHPGFALETGNMVEKVVRARFEKRDCRG
jgi:hypothetical protein